MRHLALPRFWQHYRALPKEIQQLADKNFALLQADPMHASLHFKRVGRTKQLWSVRVGRRKAGRPGLVLDRHTCRIRQPFFLIDFGDTVFRLFLQDGLRQQTKIEGRTVKAEGNRGTVFCLSAVKRHRRLKPRSRKGGHDHGF